MKLHVMTRLTSTTVAQLKQAGKIQMVGRVRYDSMFFIAVEDYSKLKASKHTPGTFVEVRQTQETQGALMHTMRGGRAVRDFEMRNSIPTGVGRVSEFFNYCVKALVRPHNDTGLDRLLLSFER